MVRDADPVEAVLPSVSQAGIDQGVDRSCRLLWRLMTLLGALWLLAELRSLKSGNEGLPFLLTVGRMSRPVGCPQVLATGPLTAGTPSQNQQEAFSLVHCGEVSDKEEPHCAASFRKSHHTPQGGDYTGRGYPGGGAFEVI